MGTDFIAGRTGWENRLDVEQGERGAMGQGPGWSAMPIRLAAACSRSMESLEELTFVVQDVMLYMRADLLFL